MFEHLRNYQSILASLSNLLLEDGKLFIHIFCNKEVAYFYEVKNDLKSRDYSDTTRKHSPLILAKDHVVIRSDILNKSEMIKKMSELVGKKLKQKYGFINKFIQ